MGAHERDNLLKKLITYNAPAQAYVVMLEQNPPRVHPQGAPRRQVEFGSELRSFTWSADNVSVEIVRHVDGKEVVVGSWGRG